ncbi:MAG: hypothetical protein ACREVL_01460 [Solimonas sp.]
MGRDFYVATLLLAFAAGGLLAIRLMRGELPTPEQTAPAVAVRQADDSLVLARVQQADPGAAPHAIPKGAKEERRIRATVQPKRGDCPPLRVDLSMLRDGDGRRVVASSPDGVVTEGSDMPIEAVLLPSAPKRWALGVSADPFAETYGLWAERDLGRLRLGVDVNQTRERDAQLRLRVGFTF